MQHTQSQKLSDQTSFDHLECEGKKQDACRVHEYFIFLHKAALVIIFTYKMDECGMKGVAVCFGFTARSVHVLVRRFHQRPAEPGNKKKRKSTEHQLPSTKQQTGGEHDGAFSS